MDQTFYPSCVVHLNFRFEQKMKLRARQSDGTSREEFLVTQQNTGVFVMNRVPRKCNVHFQGHTQAATWSIVFDYAELPVDPRTIAAATAEIYFGTVSADDFSTGMQREERSGLRRSVLKTRNEDGTRDDTFLVMVGVVDSWRIEHGDTGAEVHLEGRDLRGLLLDSPLVSSRDVFDYEGPRVQRRRKRSSILDRLNTEFNIWDLVTQIVREHETLNNLPEAERIVVRAFKEEWPNQTILSPGKGSHVPRHRRGAGGQQGQMGAAHSDMNFWDLITRYCQPGDALICKSDLTWAPISSIQVGDKLLGYAKDATSPARRKFHKYADAEVQEVFVRKAPVVALHMASGRVVRCTPDHHWFTGRSEAEYEFAMPSVGRELVRVFDNPNTPDEFNEDYKLGYARGLIEGDGAVIDRTYFDETGKRKSRTKGIFLAMNDGGSLDRYKACLDSLQIRYTEGTSRSGPGLTYKQHMVRACTQRALDVLVLAQEPTKSSDYMRGWLAGIFDAEGCTSNGLEICQCRRVNPDTWNKIRDFLRHFGFRTSDFADRIKVQGGIKEMLRFYDLVQPAAVFKFRHYILGMRMTGTKDRIVRIEELGEENVYSLKTSTGTYIGQGYASRNCYLVGAIPTFVGRELHIRYAPTLYSMISGANERIPFAGGQPRTGEGDTWNVRRMVYGRDVDSMKIMRKYTGNAKPKTVRVIALNPSSGGRGRDQLMESVWPPRNLREARREGVTGNRRTVQDFIGGQESSEILNIPVRGVTNQEQLNTIARAFYEQIGRNEISGEVSASALTSFGGSNADPDLLRIRVGDPVLLLVDASRITSNAPITNTLNRISQLPFAEAVEQLRKTTPMRDINLARAVVASVNGSIMGVLSYFRVAGAEYEWSDETASVKFDIQNYWTPRFDYGAQDNIHIRRQQHPVDHAAGQQASRAAAHSTNPRSPRPTSTRARASDELMQSIEEPANRTPRQIDSQLLRDISEGTTTPSMPSRWRGR